MTPNLTPTEIAALMLFKSVGMRFLKGGMAGAIAAVAVMTIHAPTTWTELSTVLVMLAYAAVTGFVAGGVMAIEKYLNWSDAPTA